MRSPGWATRIAKFRFWKEEKASWSRSSWCLTSISQIPSIWYNWNRYERNYHSKILLCFHVDVRKLLRQDLKAIQLVWEIIDEWNEAWERYRTENFWKIEIEEMDNTANVLFRKLNRLGRELKEKNWEIVEHLR